MPYISRPIHRVSPLGDDYVEVTVVRVSGQEYAVLKDLPAMCLPEPIGNLMGQELGVLDPDWDTLPY